MDWEHKLYSFRTHLWDKLKPGDTAFGYDVTWINVSLFDQDELAYFPEIVLVKKKFIRKNKRTWKLNRMKVDDDEKDWDDFEVDEKKKKKNKKLTAKKTTKDNELQDFLEDIEENKDIRKNIKLVRDEDVLRELTEKFWELHVEEIMKK